MKSIKKMLITILLLCIIVLSVAGCSNKKVVVATINGVSISEQLYRINLWSTQRGLEAAQEHYWSFENIEGKSPEEYVKAKTLQAITYCIMVEQKAEELNVKLTKEDKAKIKEAAKKDMKENAEFAKKYGIKQKDYEAYYTFGMQNEKVLASLANSYEPNEVEVAAKIEEMKANGQSLDQAKIIHVLIATLNEIGEQIPPDKKKEAYEKAQSILKRALDGEDISTLVNMYSADPAASKNMGEYTFTRGDGLGAAIDTAVFDKAKVGEVYPEVIETEMGYEVIKVLEIERETDAEMRERTIAPIKNEYAQKELEEMTYYADIQKTEAYDAIRVSPSDTLSSSEENESVK